MTDFDILLIKGSIQSQRQKLLQHPIYQELTDVDSLRIFMEHHVFAVWDFMLLLKSLQRKLTSTTEAWVPTENRLARRLINEIVLAEESDVDLNSLPSSHFEMYLDAMKQCGACTSNINSVVQKCAEGHGLKALIKYNVAEIEKAQLEFVRATYAILKGGKVHAVAAAFTFGREDLIPDLFSEIVRDLDQRFAGKLSAFVYYLDRHIELDADEHGPMAEQMIRELCGHDMQKWEEVKQASQKALDARLKFWDAIYSAIKTQKQLSRPVLQSH
jgi:thiaminase